MAYIGPMESIAVELDPRRRISRSSRVVFRELADGTGVLLHLDTTDYHRLNAIGVLIWNLVDDGTTLPRLIDDVRSRVIDAPDQLAEDVEGFVRDLASRGLILVADPSRPDT